MVRGARPGGDVAVVYDHTDGSKKLYVGQIVGQHRAGPWHKVAFSNKTDETDYVRLEPKTRYTAWYPVDVDTIDGFKVTACAHRLPYTINQ